MSSGPRSAGWFVRARVPPPPLKSMQLHEDPWQVISALPVQHQLPLPELDGRLPLPSCWKDAPKVYPRITCGELSWTPNRLCMIMYKSLTMTLETSRGRCWRPSTSGRESRLWTVKANMNCCGSMCSCSDGRRKAHANHPALLDPDDIVVNVHHDVLPLKKMVESCRKCR